jgi:hypothetical protein
MVKFNTMFTVRAACVECYILVYGDTIKYRLVRGTDSDEI